MVEISNKGEILLYFSAAWCGPCRQFSPLVEKTCDSGCLPLIKVMVDDEPEFVHSQNVKSVPMIKLFRDGACVGSAIGAMSETQLKDWLNSHT